MSSRFIIILTLFLSSGLVAKTFTLAAEDDYYPYSAVVDGELVGLVPELATAAFQEVGIEVEFNTGPYTRVVHMVQSGQHVGGFTGAIDESNKATFHWHTTPISTVRLAIWARTGTTAQGLNAKDMEGQKVSLTRGFFYTDAIDKNERVKKMLAPSDESSLKMLALGRSDFALVTEKIGYSVLQSSSSPELEDSRELKDRVEIVGLIDEIPLYAFFSKAHPQGKEAAELFQRGLEAIIANGTYDQIINRWLPDSE